MNKDYNVDGEGWFLLDEMIDEMYKLKNKDGDGICGLNEIVGLVCGEEFVGKYDKEDLEYVKEVMSEFFRINVGFDMERECMWIESEVDGDGE